jgi:oligopeptide transport system permease protein
LLRNRLAVAGLVVLLTITLLAILAPIIAPFDPAEQDLHETFEPPSWTHPMGTDNLGRDWFSRLLYGARVALAVGFVSQLIILAIGLPIGLLAGYRGGATDSLLMRFTDLVYAFPDLLFIILLRSVLGASLVTLFVIIGFVTWVDLARLVRGQVLSFREREFIEAARSLGAGDIRIMMRHLVPNLLGPITVVVAFGIPRAIFIEAALSFIGIGLSTATPSWGTMVHEGKDAIYGASHLVIFPSAAIAMLMLAFTFVGDGLRDALDPRAAEHAPGGMQAAEAFRQVPAPPAKPERRAA